MMYHSGAAAAPNPAPRGRMLSKRRSKRAFSGLAPKLKAAFAGAAGNLTRRRGARVVAITMKFSEFHVTVYDIRALHHVRLAISARDHLLGLGVIRKLRSRGQCQLAPDAIADIREVAQRCA